MLAPSRAASAFARARVRFRLGDDGPPLRFVKGEHRVPDETAGRRDERHDHDPGQQGQASLAGDKAVDVGRGDDRLSHGDVVRAPKVVADKSGIGPPERRDLVVGVTDTSELKPAAS